MNTLIWTAIIAVCAIIIGFFWVYFLLKKTEKKLLRILQYNFEYFCFCTSFSDEVVSKWFGELLDNLPELYGWACSKLEEAGRIELLEEIRLSKKIISDGFEAIFE